MFKTLKKLFMFGVIGSLLFVCSNSYAAYPNSVDNYVNDFAAILSPEDTHSLRNILDELEYQSGIEFTVVTIGSRYDYSTGDTSIESFATNLFNYWGVGNRRKNNGVMFLIALKDRQCRIELGKGYGHTYDRRLKKIIDERITPLFKQERYSSGIIIGTKATIQEITREVGFWEFYKYHILVSILIVVFLCAGLSCLSQGKSGWGWAFLAMVGFLIVLLFKMLLSGNRTSGYNGTSFGGGGSFGGGASGSW